MDAVLEGAGVDEGGAGSPFGEAAVRALGAGGARLTEPRPGTWFKRRVHPIASARELWHFRELILTLAERDLRVRYKQATLGLAWAVISPVAMMVAFTLIFTKVGHVNPQSHGVPYALFSYMGLLPWTFFATSVSAGGLSLVGNLALINKLYCPRDVFPIAAMADAAVDAIIASLVLLIMFPLLGVAPKPETYYVPLLLIVLVMFSLGVALMISAVVVFMRDLALLLPLVVQFGLFVTPVIYSPQTLFKSETLLIVYSIINPLVPVLDGFRRCVLYGEAPEWVPLAAAAGMSALVLVGGFMLFKKLETGIADVA
jgi:ABC-type polysaccharide/polyol phosphate export permease